MRSRPSPALAALFLSTLATSIPDAVSAQGISAEFDSCGVGTAGESVEQITTVNFHAYKVPAVKSLYANRDLEFLWSDSYVALFGRPLNAPRASTDTDLDLFGVTICNTPGTGAFAFPVPYIQLIYDYLRAPGFGRPASVDNYNTNPAEVLGFAMPQATYGDLDRNHADAYIFAPRFSGDPLYAGGGVYGGDGGNPYPQWPSVFLDADEDVTSGHPASLDSAFAYRFNSISIPGPTPSQVGVGGTGDWTGPAGLAALVFNHEFQHAINSPGVVLPSAPVSEILSAVVAALDADRPETPAFDVPYTWGLLRPGLNYQAYRSLAAYLTYNFRGTDLSFAGRSDDLVWRWARSSDRLLVSGLGQQLTDANCAECATKTYFSGLPNGADRLKLLLHNWRVANYVNKPALAEGQYGYPSQFGFDPIDDLGSWQNIDTGAADSANIEQEVMLDASHLTHEVSQAGRPVGILNPENAHAVALATFGSDYWVVRSDPSLWSANHDLVIRIMPEGRCGVRLFISAIAYNEQNLAGGQADKLWRHPEWAQLAVAPVWTDVGGSVDSDPLEIVVPNFGQTHKAALVVLSAAGTVDTGTNDYELAYRVNFGLRTPPFQNPNPIQVTNYASPYLAGLPTWSPAGDQVAFSRADAGPGPDQIYRAPATGGTPTVLFPQPFSQFYPDWSPRGDWVSFDQAAGGGGCDIWAVNLTTGQSRQLTTSPNHEFAATFSPNGQQLVYVRTIPLAGNELRRINLDGTNDTLLVPRTDVALEAPRWSPDGPLVFFKTVGAVPDSLYSVAAVGPTRGHVAPIAELVAGEIAFDPPRGAGRWAWETNWHPMSCAGNTTTRRRIALRTVPTSMSETVFGRPNSDVMYPRWSWDGTRVAFTSSRPIPAIPANIFVGQVTCNHAPTFVGLDDVTAFSGEAFGMTVTATDPDGEPLTYQAPTLFLPPGASFDSQTRTLSWPNPVSGDYFVVFRALDPSGGVAHRVIRLYVSPLGGCPFVDTRTASGWREENSILGRSLTGALALDPYRIKFAPEVSDGRVRFRLRENEQEYTTLDHVRLIAVDHAPELRSYAIGDRVYTGTRAAAHRVRTHTGRDITALVNGTGTHYLGSPGDTLFVQMTAPRVEEFYGATGTQDGGGGEGGMEADPKEMELAPNDLDAHRARPTSSSPLDAAVLGSTGIIVEVPDGAGGWRTLAHYYPRRYRDEIVLDSLGMGPCRLIFVGRHRFGFIGRYIRSGTQPAAKTLALLEARHSRLGDATTAVARSAGANTLLGPGDTLTLEFSTEAAAPGGVRDYFLLSTGVYSATAPIVQGSGGDLEAESRPTRFALQQNQPNPFARTTAFRFELPEPAPARLEIFDLQGRSVAVLADGLWPGGLHTVAWDRRDSRGSMARPGVYLYRLTAGSFSETRKLLISP